MAAPVERRDKVTGTVAGGLKADRRCLKHLKQGGLGNKADDDRNEGGHAGDVLEEEVRSLPPSTRQASHQVREHQ